MRRRSESSASSARFRGQWRRSEVRNWSRRSTRQRVRSTATQVAERGRPSSRASSPTVAPVLRVATTASGASGSCSDRARTSTAPSTTMKTLSPGSDWRMRTSPAAKATGWASSTSGCTCSGGNWRKRGTRDSSRRRSSRGISTPPARSADCAAGATTNMQGRSIAAGGRTGNKRQGVGSGGEDASTGSGDAGWRFETRVVHGGRNSGPVSDVEEPRPEGLGTPVVPGIQVSSGYYFPRLRELNRAFEDPNEGYVYARHGGPTTDLFAQAVAQLEGADAAVSFASGMAAIHAALLAAEVGPGKGVVAARDLYGATQTLLTSVLGAQGVDVRLVDATDLGATRTAVQEQRPRVVYVETISNPLLRVADVPALAEI